MSKISFNPETFGIVTGAHYGNVGGPASGCAFVPIMARCSGIESIIEGLRLADIECLPSSGGGRATKNVDP